jgi:hypothetical protein
MMLQHRPQLRRWILAGTPLLTGILLLFHPRPNPAELGLAEPLTGPGMYAMLAAAGEAFLVVHALFAPLLVLLGLAIHLLLEGQRGLAATLSRVSAFVFVVSYGLYETIIGTASALIEQAAAGLPPEAQAAAGEIVLRIWGGPLFGDLPSAVATTAWLSWLLAVALAALALRRAGRPLGPCLLLGFSFVFISHASPLGTLGMLLFLLAVLRLERAETPAVARAQVKAPAG